MAILDKEVWVRLGGNNIKYYESLGYEIPRHKNKYNKWVIKKDTKLLVKIEDLQKSSTAKVRYICDYCNGINQIEEKEKYIKYDTLMFSRKKINKDCCKKCMGKKLSESISSDPIPIGESLAEKLPEIAKEWLYEKNEKTPFDYRAKSNKHVWWICEKGHEWKVSISKRANDGTNCPYCSNQKICIDNCLATINPELILEWNPDKNDNLTPYNVSPNSGKYVWWKCKTCNHEWKTIVNHRSKGSGCPICSESKGEKAVRKWLEENNVQFEPQKEFEGLIGLGGGLLSYDFYLPELNLLIEYQGEFHDGKGGKDSFTKSNLEKQREHDNIKCDYAERNGIKLLEIWYWDFERIEEILMNKII